MLPSLTRPRCGLGNDGRLRSSREGPGPGSGFLLPRYGRVPLPVTRRPRKFLVRPFWPALLRVSAPCAMAVELAEPIAAGGPARERFASFEAFYRRYQPALVSTCTTLTGSRAAAEDLAQETLLRAYQHIDGLDADRAWGWLKTVASRLAIDDARKLGRVRPLEDEDVAEGAAEG